MNTEATLKIAQERNLSTRLLDQIGEGKDKGYCPGFRLWEVNADGERLLMAGDDAGAVDTRLFFQGIDKRQVDVTITRIGDNPDKAEWERVTNYR